MERQLGPAGRITGGEGRRHGNDGGGAVIVGRGDAQGSRWLLGALRELAEGILRLP